MSRHIATGEAVWLDTLPDDVCNRIAAYVAASDILRSSLSLSKLSPTQRIAVKHALSYKINMFDLTCFSDNTESMCEEVIALLGDDVRAISEDYLKAVYSDYPQCVKKCFRMPSLRTALLFSSDKALDDIVHAKNLRSLCIEFDRTSVEDYRTSLKRLSVLDIRILVIQSIRVCFRDLFGTNDNYSQLATWFPHVEELALFCCTNESYRHTSSNLWRTIEPFPALKEVTITEEVPEDAVAKLQTMDRVTLSREAVLQLVDKIPDRVVCILIDGIQEGFFMFCNIRFPAYYTDRTLLQRFAACERLEILDCCIERGVETDLFKVMRNLRSLTLFARRGRDEPELGFFDPEDPYVPIPGAILEAVKAAPYLKSLSLKLMRIERSELNEILKVLGTRLEVFREFIHLSCRLTYHHRPEACWGILKEDISAIQTAARHNQSLRSFRIDMDVEWFTDIQVVLPLLSQLRQAVEALYRRAPAVDADYLQSVSRRFFTAATSTTSAESEHNDAGE